MKKILACLLSIVLVASLLTGCKKKSDSESETATLATVKNQQSTTGNSENSNTSTEAGDKFDVTNSYSDVELVQTYSANSVGNTIVLNNSSIKVNGEGMEVNGTTLTINKAGIYLVSGTLDDGQIIVDTDKNSDVVLILNGVSITSSKSAPIYAKKTNILIINLVEGTKNILSDATTYVYPDAETDEPNACLYSDDGLTINGAGALSISGNFNNGIVAKDLLKMLNGNVTVNAKNNGVKGKDGVVISGGTLTVDAKADGIKADNDTDTSKGYILIEGGTMKITSGEDGIQAESCLKITDGTIDIYTGEGSGAVSTGDGWATRNPWGQQSSTSSDTVSMKGIKAVTDITIAGGIITIDSEDDSIHTNNSVLISGGTLDISSGDDGVHADTELTVSGGEITVKKSYEGYESSTINIDGGHSTITSNDDGLNAAGGNDQSSLGGRQGMNGFSSSTGTLNISGGYLYVNAAGDGLDSNGSIYMTGGEVYADGPTDNGNGTIDYGDGNNCTFSMKGGNLIAVGSTGMAQSATCADNSYGVSIYFTATKAAKSVISIKDSSGSEIVSYTAAKTYGFANIVSDKFAKGETYTIYVDGTKEDSFTISANNTTVGTRVGGMGGGPGGMGGRR